MLTFREFSESEKEKGEEKALEVVRKGMNLQRGSDFWEDLLHLCGNAEGMAALLEVPRDRITGLAGRVSDLRKKIGEADDASPNKKLMKTGSGV